MAVYRSALLFSACAFAALTPSVSPHASGSQKDASSWKSAKLDVVAIARRVDAAFPKFDHVACGVTMDYKAPTTVDPQGWGTGHQLMNEYVWSPNRFRIQYMSYPKPKKTRDEFGHTATVLLPPLTEYLARDKGRTLRLGQYVGTENAAYSSKTGLFDRRSDDDLVEAWPVQFPQLLFSPLVGGNATIGRYVAALARGTGGYKLETSTRSITVNGKPVAHNRIVATRPARGKKPASRVEMIFQASLPYLPVSMTTSYGDKHEVRWSAQWYNHANLDKVSPGGPFHINQ